MCGPHWWLRSYSSQASEGCKLRAVFILNLLRAAFFSVLQFLVSLVALGYMMPGGPMSGTETKGERKRTTTTIPDNTSNNSYLAEEVIPQILSLGTKPFVIFTDALFKVDAYLFRNENRIFIVNWN